MKLKCVKSIAGIAQRMQAGDQMIFQTQNEDTSNNTPALDDLGTQTDAFVTELQARWEALRQGVADNGIDWAIGIAAIIALYIVFRLLRVTVSGLLKTDRKAANSFRNVVANLISGTNSFLIVVGAVALVSPFIFSLGDTTTLYIQKAFIILMVVQLALWSKVVANAFLTRAAEKSNADSSTLGNALSVMTILANVVIFAIAGMTILQNIGVNVTALVAGLGVGGIAIALAAQNIFKDLFASMSIILDKPFSRGDFIQYGAGINSLGFVEKIGLKTTRIKSLSGEELVIGNNQLLETDLRNYRRMTERRILFQLGVTYQTPHAQLEKIPGYIKGIIENTENVRFDRAHMASFADSAIAFEIVYFVLSREYMDYMNANQQIMLAIHSKFEDEGIDFAYPTRTMWLAGGSEARNDLVPPPGGVDKQSTGSKDQTSSDQAGRDQAGNAPQTLRRK